MEVLLIKQLTKWISTNPQQGRGTDANFIDRKPFSRPGAGYFPEKCAKTKF